MTTATLYDVHGSLAALEAVLSEVPADATIAAGGDVVAALELFERSVFERSAG